MRDKGVPSWWRGAQGPGSLEPADTTPFGRWLSRHALLVDLVVASVVFLYDLMYFTSLLGLHDLELFALAGAVVLSAVSCALYVLRRNSPLVVSIAAFVAAWGYVLLDIGLAVAPLVVLILMLYFVGTRFDWKVAVPAAVAVSTWVIDAGVPLIQTDRLRIGEAGMLVLTSLLAATVGLWTRSRRHHVDGLRAFARQLARERDAQARVAAAEERARIAREIHDIVSHSLGTMIVVADGAALTAEAEPKRASAMMTQVRDTGRTAMTDMRRMLDVLRDTDLPSRAPQPGLAQLDRLVGELRSTGLSVGVSITGEPVELPSGVDLAAYRIVQEGLTNARKHGGPMLSLVQVAIAYGDRVVDLRIVDDGQGPPPERDAEASGGHGLVGMRERVTAYGGTLEVGARPDGGFNIHAVLPSGGEQV